jgi:hypothetical protein
MVLPNLIHPVTIIIEKLNTAGTIYDEDTREPIKQAAHAVPVPVRGQVSWDIKDEVVIGEGGTRLEANGYILFRYVDLNSAGITLSRQDRIKKIGWMDVDVYVVSLKPMGHYGDRNGASMVKAFFTDRAPSRNA